MDVRFPAPQTDNTLDCVLLEGSWQRYCWRRWRSRVHRSWPPRSPVEIQNRVKLAESRLPAEVVQSGLETLRSHLEQVQGDTVLLYEIT